MLTAVIFHALLTMVVDATTTLQAEDYEDTGLRCHKRGCHGHIMALIDQEESFIYWGCTDCNNEGRIDGWRGSRWDTGTVSPKRGQISQ